MALLDRDGVYGAPRFHMAAKKAKIKAHIGAEVTAEISNCRLQIADSKAPNEICNLQSETLQFFSPASSRFFPRRLSKPMPPDHKDEAARRQR